MNLCLSRVFAAFSLVRLPHDLAGLEEGHHLIRQIGYKSGQVSVRCAPWQSVRAVSTLDNSTCPFVL